MRRTAFHIHRWGVSYGNDWAGSKCEKATNVPERIINRPAGSGYLSILILYLNTGFFILSFVLLLPFKALCYWDFNFNCTATFAAFIQEITWLTKINISSNWWKCSQVNIWMGLFLTVFGPSRQVPEHCIKLGHDCFFQHRFQFTVH